MLHPYVSVFVEMRRDKNYVVEKCAEFSFGLLEWLRSKVLNVSVVSIDRVRLSSLDDFARDVNSVALELSNKLIEELHMRPLKMEDWDWGVLSV